MRLDCIHKHSLCIKEIFMIDLLGALSILSAAIQTSDSLINVFEWLKGKVAAGSTPQAVVMAIQALPADATAEQIAAVVAPFIGKGGDVELRAGDNGGGDVYVQRLDMSAGAGPAGGGKAIVRGGNGGPDGGGGKLTIGSGTIRGGNAS
jgi:hypothetical protein